MKMNKRILILGASGLLGNEVYSFFKDKNPVGTTFRKNIQGFIRADLTKECELERILKKVNPEIVINCLKLGGFFNKNKEQTRKVNYEVNKKLAEVFEGKVILFSTDSVFDGKKRDYIETDEPNPINNYGRTKYMGEQVLLSHKKNTLILRVGLLYKNIHRGYMKFVYDNLKNDREIDCWKEIVSCPTHIDDVCFYLNHLLEQNTSGIYHLIGSEEISRYQFAVRIAKTFGLNKNLIKHPIYSGEIKRPRNTSMKSTRLKVKLRGVEFK